MKTYDSNPFLEVGDIEKEAREITGNLFERGWDDWGLVERVVAKALKADYYSERTMVEWIELANILERTSIDVKDEETLKRVKNAFNRMVRGGYLYSKAGSAFTKGKRVYGINYTRD